MIRRFLSIMVTTLALSACAANSGDSGGLWDLPSLNNRTDEQAYAAASDPVALRIAEAADKAATALQDLARVEQTRRPPMPEPATSGAPDELQGAVTVNWVGDAEPLVRNLATRLNYDVSTYGTKPVVPVIVRVNQQNRPLVEALQTIGEQGTEFLDLIVDPVGARIEIHYKLPEATRS